MKKLLFAVALLALLASCSDVQDGVEVLMGNYAFQRGDYQKASLHYLHVTHEARFSPWINYNLGNVYNALGEANTAMAAWNLVDEKAPEELLFRLNFNKGVLQLQKGLYQEAYESFKKALILHPVSLDAKRNLELSLQKIQNMGKQLPPRSTEKSDAANQAGPESRALLDYIRRLEGNRWKSNPQKAESASSSDW